MRNFSFHFYNPFDWFFPFNWGNIFRPYTQPANKGIVLTSDQTYSAQSNDVIAGAAGNETVTLSKGITKVYIDSKVENINLAGGLFDYNLKTFGQKVNINTGTFSTNIATVQPSTSGTHLVFGDGSKVTLTQGGYGSAQVHYDTVQLLDNRTTTVGNSDVVIKGGNGAETLKLNAGLYHATIDHNVETLVLARSLMESNVVSTAGHIQVLDDTNNPVITWDVAQGDTHVLQFDNALGQITLGTDGNAVFTLKDVYLDSGETYTPDTNGITLHGTNSSGWWFADQPRVVILTDTVHDIHIDDGIQEVDLSGAVDSYQYQEVQGELKIFDSTGSTIASIQIPLDSEGTILQFGNTQYQAVEGADGIYLNNVKVSESEPAPLAAPISPDTSGSGTTSQANFDYSLSLGNFGSYASKIENILHTALDNIGHFVTAKGTFDIQVLPERNQNSILAEAAPATASVPTELTGDLLGANNSSIFQIESLTGIDPNGNQPDATLYINMAHAASFNFDSTSYPTANQYDLTTTITHELVHALGFSGFRSDSSASAQSPFDQEISLQNGLPYFNGKEAEAVYGGPVPLAPASLGTGSAYYHVHLPDNSDLMSDSLGKGEVRTLSTLDLAMLDDIGIQVVGSLPVTA